MTPDQQAAYASYQRAAQQQSQETLANFARQQEGIHQYSSGGGSFYGTSPTNPIAPVTAENVLATTKEEILHPETIKTPQERGIGIVPSYQEAAIQKEKEIYAKAGLKQPTQEENQSFYGRRSNLTPDEIAYYSKVYGEHPEITLPIAKTLSSKQLQQEHTIFPNMSPEIKEGEVFVRGQGYSVATSKQQEFLKKQIFQQQPQRVLLTQDFPKFNLIQPDMTQEDIPTTNIIDRIYGRAKAYGEEYQKRKIEELELGGKRINIYNGQEYILTPTYKDDGKNIYGERGTSTSFIPDLTPTTFVPYSTKELANTLFLGEQAVAIRIGKEGQSQYEKVATYNAEQLSKDAQQEMNVRDEAIYNKYLNGDITYEEYVSQFNKAQEEINANTQKKLNEVNKMVSTELQRQGQVQYQEATFLSGLSGATYQFLSPITEKITGKPITPSSIREASSTIAGTQLIGLNLNVPEQYIQFTTPIVAGATSYFIRKAPSIVVASGTAYLTGMGLGFIGATGRLGGITADVIAGSAMYNVGKAGYGLAKKGAGEITTFDLTGLGETVGEAGVFATEGAFFAKGFGTGVEYGGGRYYGVADYLFHEEEIKGTRTKSEPRSLSKAQNIKYYYEDKSYPLKLLKGTVIYPERTAMVQSRAGELVQDLFGDYTTWGTPRKVPISPKTIYLTSAYYEPSEKATYGTYIYQKKGSKFYTLAVQIAKPVYTISDVVKNKGLSPTEKALLKDYMKTTGKKVITQSELESMDIPIVESISMEYGRAYPTKPKVDMITKGKLGVRVQVAETETDLLIFGQSRRASGVTKGLSIAEEKPSGVSFQTVNFGEEAFAQPNLPTTLFVSKTTGAMKKFTPYAKSSRGLIFDISGLQGEPLEIGKKTFDFGGTPRTSEVPEINMLALNNLRMLMASNKATPSTTAQIYAAPINIPAPRATPISSLVPLTRTIPLIGSPISKTELKQKEITSEESILRFDLSPREKVKQEVVTKEIPAQGFGFGSGNAEANAFVELVKQEEQQKQEQKQEDTNKQIHKPITTTTSLIGFDMRTEYNKPEEPKPTKIKLPKVEEEETSSKERGYIPLVKFGGVYKSVGKPMTKSKALAYGALQTDVTLARSFKIVPTKKMVKREKPFETSLTKFRGFSQTRGKRTPLQMEYIERSKFALEKGEEAIIRPLSVRALKAKAKERNFRLY